MAKLIGFMYISYLWDIGRTAEEPMRLDQGEQA